MTISPSFAMDYQLVAQQSHIKFLGKSTLHDFNGQANDIQGIFIDPFNTTLTNHGQINITTQSLDTHLLKRDKKMWHMFDTIHYPEITFEISHIETIDPQHANINGKLTIKNHSIDITIPSLITTNDHNIILDATFPLSLKTLHLTPPSVLGIIKVADTVTVDAHLIFSSKDIHQGSSNETL
jgi:polyisoprenoid-binding protein YceI